VVKDLDKVKWKNFYHFRNDTPRGEALNRNDSKNFKEITEKVQGRPKLMETIPTKDEIDNKIESERKAKKNKELKFKPTFNEKVFSVESKKMIPRPKSSGKLGPELIERF